MCVEWPVLPVRCGLAKNSKILLNVLFHSANEYSLVDQSNVYICMNMHAHACMHTHAHTCMHVCMHAHTLLKISSCRPGRRSGI